MTLFLVFAMVAVLVTAQWYFVRQRRRAAERARSAVRYVELGPTAEPAADVLFHPGHTWLQVHGDGLASVGLTAFAGNFAGEIDQIDMPPEGKRLRQAERGWSVVSKGGRRLDLAMPVGGRVLAVNPAVLRDPTLIQRRPYDQGWILRIKPSRAAAAVRNLLPLRAAQSWLDAARVAVTSRLSRTSTVPAYDGGEWAPAFGEWLEEEDWTALRQELFPALPPPLELEDEL
jgi:glycine cleavage system H protein